MKFLIDAAIELRNSLNNQTDQVFVRDRKLGETIPKIIHQTYFKRPDAPDFPEELKANVQNLEEQNPDWEYRFYDDTEIEKYIQKYFPELLEYYQKIDHRYGAARADFFRYLVMYREGGAYLDIKSSASEPLSDLVQPSDRFILSHWPRSWPKIMLGQHPGISNPIGELQQWYIICAPGHPFLKAVINNVCNNIECYNPVVHDYGSWGVFNLTGPIAYTEAIYPILEDHPHRLEADHLAVGLIYCAIGPENSTGGHQQLFTRRHYSKLNSPIVSVPLHTRAMFFLSQPIVKLLKTLHRYRQRIEG
ncbi:glycosyltransferase family 32 protein [Ruegeria arenilitoris]|uniref:glycosyltransferase family 32 protein n=1 Tax=Ruegeria arenilitoris TaxID=1173585 RepID=UPI00147F5919|nr:glycosyltransferase [Ruegeria arenilitoris]